MRLFSSLSAVSGLVLVLVIAWALAAVLMLTRTAVDAGQINERVAVIEGDLSEVNRETDKVALTEEINESAAGILEAAEPLEGQLDKVLASTQSIDATVAEILNKATSINTTVGSIGSTVDSIHGRVSSIRSVAADEITPGVVAINRKADVATITARSINRDTTNTLTQVRGDGQGGVHDHANSIDCALESGLLGLVVNTENCNTHPDDDF